MQHSTIDSTGDVGSGAVLNRAPSGSHGRTPRAVVWTAGLAIAGLVGGAVYLVVVRGDALLLDLSGLSKYVFCF